MNIKTEVKMQQFNLSKVEINDMDEWGLEEIDEWGTDVD